MAEALPVTKKARGPAGGAYEARLKASEARINQPDVKNPLTVGKSPVGSVSAAPVKTIPPPVKPDVKFHMAAPVKPIAAKPEVKAPAAPVVAPNASIEQRILANLNEGWKNANDKFKDRTTFDASYGYASKTPEQRAILDSFWSSKKGSEATATAQKKETDVLPPKAIGVVDKGSQEAFQLPAVAANQKAEQLINNQEELNAKMLANLESSTSPILAKTREQYAEFTSMMSKAKADNAAQVAALKDLQAGQNQEIDIAKAGQIRAMEAGMAAKGITGYAAMAAIAQASGDPKFIQAATDIKKKYITDLSLASAQLEKSLTGILEGQAALTTSEAATLKEIRTQKDTIDATIKDLKKAAIDSSFKPLEDYATAKTGVAQANDVTNFDVRAEQATWLKSDVTTKIATLQRKLFSQMGGAAERGLVTNEDYAKAAKMASFAEGQAYLESVIASKKQSNAVGLTSAANPSPSVTQPVGQFSAEKVNSVLSAYASGTAAQRKQIVDAMNKSSAMTDAEKAFFKSQFSAIDSKPSSTAAAATETKKVESSKPEAKEAQMTPAEAVTLGRGDAPNFKQELKAPRTYDQFANMPLATPAEKSKAVDILSTMKLKANSDYPDNKKGYMEFALARLSDADKIIIAKAFGRDASFTKPENAYFLRALGVGIPTLNNAK